MRHTLGKNIRATLLYHSVLKKPLTTFEVWQRLVQYYPDEVATLSEVEKKLHLLALDEQVYEYQGFWFVEGDGHLIKRRIQTSKISIQKLRDMQKLARKVSWVPFVRSIAATGSVAAGQASAGSDWDMLVIFKQDKIFTGRFILGFVLHVMGKRRHGAYIANRACLNSLITTDGLHMDPEDWYGAYEYINMVPFFGLTTVQEFRRENIWINEALPHVTPLKIETLFLSDESRWVKRVRGGLECLLGWGVIETILKWFQIQKITNNPDYQTDKRIVVSDEQLIFLPDPRGPKVFHEFLRRL